MGQALKPTILVVDDEPLVRLVAAEMVEDAGWSAIEAADSSEALSALSANPNIRVLFTDINMPGMDGLELARFVHRIYPAIQLVITSGKRALSDIELPDDGTFLAKPYDSDQLVRVIEAKLRS
jgi:two-component system, response regulator PdtaR